MATLKVGSDSSGKWGKVYKTAMGWRVQNVPGLFHTREEAREALRKIQGRRPKGPKLEVVPKQEKLENLNKPPPMPAAVVNTENGARAVHQADTTVEPVTMPPPTVCPQPLVTKDGPKYITRSHENGKVEKLLVTQEVQKFFNETKTNPWDFLNAYTMNRVPEHPNNPHWGNWAAEICDALENKLS